MRKQLSSASRCRRMASRRSTTRCTTRGRSGARHCGRLDLIHIHPLRRIFPGVAGGAISGEFAFAAGALHALEREISERIGAGVLANFFDGFIGGDELLLRGRIHPIETWRDGWRAGDAEMDLSRAGAAHHAHDLSAGGAAHDGIVNQDDTLAFERAAHRIELELHAEIAHRLLRLDEGAANVVVADQSEAKWNTTLGGVSHGRGDAGIGPSNHDVGIYRSFARQLPAEQLAADVDWPSENHAVRPGKINVFENACRLLRFGRVVARRNPFRANHNHLAGFYVALVIGADEIE